MEEDWEGSEEDSMEVSAEWEEWGWAWVVWEEWEALVDSVATRTA